MGILAAAFAASYLLLGIVVPNGAGGHLDERRQRDGSEIIVGAAQQVVALIAGAVPPGLELVFALHNSLAPLVVNLMAWWSWYDPADVFPLDSFLGPMITGFEMDPGHRKLSEETTVKNNVWLYQKHSEEALLRFGEIELAACYLAKKLAACEAAHAGPGEESFWEPKVLWPLYALCLGVFSASGPQDREVPQIAELAFDTLLTVGATFSGTDDLVERYYETVVAPFAWRSDDGLCCFVGREGYVDLMKISHFVLSRAVGRSDDGAAEELGAWLPDAGRATCLVVGGHRSSQYDIACGQSWLCSFHDGEAVAHEALGRYGSHNFG